MKNNKRTLRWALLIIWMIIIFIFSQLPGNVSDEQSHAVIYIFKLLGLRLDSFFGDLANFAVRKASHFSEYFILFLLALNLTKTYFNKWKSRNIALLIVFLYACSDEFHQIFIPGRTAAIRDVLIDTCGGLLAYLISTLISRRRQASN
ncbi:VanZ family protein [Clostridium sp. YIM B02551]|uniref:VanZ family protein n=1 Tax=Clostridium sp. YIM B02551 TaxID=2910679 RepID=UPI001EEC0930|nr:VanZ family protein [Clostridium sp. YIM B02551]